MDEQEYELLKQKYEIIKEALWHYATPSTWHFLRELEDARAYQFNDDGTGYPRKGYDVAKIALDRVRKMEQETKGA